MKSDRHKQTDEETDTQTHRHTDRNWENRKLEGRTEKWSASRDLYDDNSINWNLLGQTKLS